MTTETTTISTDPGNVHRAAVGIRPTARGDGVEGDPAHRGTNHARPCALLRDTPLQPSNRAATVEEQSKGPIRGFAAIAPEALMKSS